MSTMAIVTFTVIGILIFVYAIFVVWVTIGGAFDLRAMFRDLAQERVDITDDGFVQDEQSSVQSVKK